VFGFPVARWVVRSTSAARWPVVLRHGSLTLQPLRKRDHIAWTQLRKANMQWLQPWDSTPPNAGDTPPGFFSMQRQHESDARRGICLPWAMWWEGTLIGQMFVGGITYGPVLGCFAGYWIDRRYAGRGITPLALSLAAVYAFDTCSLHRLEVSIRPENQASIRVAEKLGFVPEGVRRSFLHVDGAWRDHNIYAVIADEVQAPAHPIRQLLAGQ